ncbi:hypothetical protein [Pseudomonas citronellolis]|uniref:hypothetical protein n=1 Tax=Pseudomonas citronellolis TaxID=53408 RepID=UPI0020A110EA|nr:hypothetical protein [Pseudomonas citronellolis]MCP1605738.1 hypothetical protein [Pseudomonas citronellolis]MCP1656107.1 hypothetical protein [Pseudomonas citronellolis]MCP1722267.1 hypothetical protein [Pseudomonas citronellolis]
MRPIRHTLSAIQPILFSAALCCLSSTVLHAADKDLPPLHFSDVPALIEDFGDYSAENGTFRLVSTVPLRIQLSPMVVPGDLPENDAREIRRAALYGVYRTFVHTDAKAVKVIVVPKEVDLKTGKSHLRDKPSIEVTATRDQALKAVKKLIKANQFADLVQPEQMGTIQLDNWRDDFETLYFKDAGQIDLLNAIKASGGDLVNNG